MGNWPDDQRAIMAGLDMRGHIFVVDLAHVPNFEPLVFYGFLICGLEDDITNFCGHSLITN
jgi:hypothetical protein